MFRVVCFFLPKFGLAVVCISVLNIEVAYAGATHYSSIAKCSRLQFPKPESPELANCPVCDVDAKGVLNCQCLTGGPKSELKETSLSIYSCPRNYAYPRCAEHIRVINGELSCRKISEESTYQNKCYGCIAEGSILKCDCWHKNREHKTSELDMTFCKEPISSCEGVLTCGLCSEPVRKISWAHRFVKPFAISAAATLPFVFLVRYAWIHLKRN